MKELKHALIWGIVLQIIFWGVFTIIDEFISHGADLSLGIGIFFCIVLLVLYFVYINKIIVKNKLKGGLFKVLLFVIWGLLSIGITFLAGYLVEQGVLQKCTSGGWECFLHGIEYILYGMIMLALETIIAFIELIINGIKLIKSKINSKN